MFTVSPSSGVWRVSYSESQYSLFGTGSNAVNLSRGWLAPLLFPKNRRVVKSTLCQQISGWCSNMQRRRVLQKQILSARGGFCYLQPFDAHVGVEIHLQLLHFGFQLRLFLLQAGQAVSSHLGLSPLLGHLVLSKEHLPKLSSSPDQDPHSARGSFPMTRSLSYLG